MKEQQKPILWLESPQHEDMCQRVAAAFGRLRTTVGDDKVEVNHCHQRADQRVEKALGLELWAWPWGYSVRVITRISLKWVTKEEPYDSTSRMK